MKVAGNNAVQSRALLSPASQVYSNQNVSPMDMKHLNAIQVKQQAAAQATTMILSHREHSPDITTVS
jgi:hypothetical protein